MKEKEIDLGILEIQILLKCSEGAFTKTNLSQIARNKYSLLEKQRIIKKLVAQDLIMEKALPKIGSTKVPVFYILTEAGKKWIDDYKKNYPIV